MLTCTGAMTKFLPGHLLVLFAPNPPMPFFEPEGPEQHARCDCVHQRMHAFSKTACIFKTCLFYLEVHAYLIVNSGYGFTEVVVVISGLFCAHRQYVKKMLGVSSYLDAFEDPSDCPPPPHVETLEERRARRVTACIFTECMHFRRVHAFSKNACILGGC